jgi:alpha-tubulin suppressor-like RCC1 family protein
MTLLRAARRGTRGGRRRFLAVAALAGTVIFGMGVQAAGAADAVPPSVTVTASPSAVTTGDGSVTLSYTIANASSCYFSPNSKAGIYQDVEEHCATTPSGTLNVVLPLNSGTTTLTDSFKFTAAGSTTKVKTVKVTVAPGAGRAPLAGVKTVVGTLYGQECAVLSSGGVDCWGSNPAGQLGNGTVTAPQSCGGSPCATTPYAVVGVGGVGTTLSNVVQLAVDDMGTFCARLSSGGVDCWGPELFGELGNNSGTGPLDCGGLPCSPSPVVVVDASGPLGGVVDLRADTEQAFCALLTTHRVDCWGYGGDSNTGNGTTNYTNPIAAPVIAVGSEGDIQPPALTGVASLTDGGVGFCAILISGRDVVCWGFNRYGNLGMGAAATAPNSCHGEGPGYGDCSAEPQVVVTSGGTALSGVTKVVPDGFYGWCAILTSGGADCWGDNSFGELGTGSISDSVTCYPSEPCLPYASPVVDTTGSEPLLGVKNLVSDENPGGSGPLVMCAILTSGGIDCWGQDRYGALGDGTDGAPSPTPVAIPAPGTTTPLAGVTKVATNAIDGSAGGFCAVASGHLDCWGYYGGTSPVTAITGVGGKGTLSGVTNVTSIPSAFGYCAVLAGGEVDCLASINPDGELGTGSSGPDTVTPPAPLNTSPFNSPTKVFAAF